MGAVVLAIVSVTAQITALAAASGVTPGMAAASDAKARMAASLIRGINCGGAASSVSSCVQAGTTFAAPAKAATVTLPNGSKQCPNSAPGASCAAGPAAPIDFGAAAIPKGLTACPADPAKPIPNVPGACGASPTVSALPAPGPIPTPNAGGGSPAVVLSPAASKVTDTAQQPALSLSIDKSVLAAGQSATLTASSTLAVDGTPWAIEIFDETTGSLLGACSQASQCTVAFAANAGSHNFVAYVTKPTASLPTLGVRMTSNSVSAEWLGIRLSTVGPAVAGANHAVTFTADSTADVTGSRYAIELWDVTARQRLTFCSRGLSCSTSLIEPAAGTHVVAADLGLVGPTPGMPNVLATSSVVQAKWITIGLEAGATRSGNVFAISLNATASADLTDTPWAIYIYSDAGQLVGGPCNTGTCAATLNVSTSKLPSFYATVAQRIQAGDAASTPLQGVLDKVRSSAPKPDVQARSATVTPSRMMWGVDSCKSFTDAPDGSSGLVQQVSSMLGAPDFWGRYLPNTDNCPGLSGTEIAAAHTRHMAILPIYNDYDCSAVSGNSTGSAYGLAAIHWAQNDIIPLGTAIAIDIEPEGSACPGAANVDTGFIQGWYDQLVHAGYVPAFYGNTAPGSAFANAWCTTVQQRPEIANNSFLWTFEPSLLGNFSRSNSPGYAPYNAGCAGRYAVWQYTLSAGATPDVDHDEATSNFPFWYP